MGDKPLVFHDDALAELRSAVSWYFERNQTAAVKFAQEIEEAVELIRDSPDRWSVGEYNTRKFVLRRYPFLIFYRELPEVIQVLAVSHGRRRPGYWQHRL